MTSRQTITTCSSLVLLLGLCLSVGAPSHANSSIAYNLHRINGVPAHVVTVNLNDPRVRVTVKTSQNGIGTAETYRSFIRRTQPAAAITGTFFSTSTLLPVGDIVIRGLQRHSGPAGTAFCITPENGVVFQPRQWGRTYDWSAYDTVLSTGPTLIRDGRIVLSPRDEGYRDPSLFTQRPRTAIGHTKHNKLLMVAVNRPIYLGDMARILRSLGAVDAVGLDGGSSSALYHMGRTYVQPQRSLTNLLVVYRAPKATATRVASVRSTR
jgi:exopolysaccharide biosynthesis protein